MDLLSQALLAQTCQRTTMMWPQRLFVRLETSEIIHEGEKKFEKFFSRTQKYFTCPASCEGMRIWLTGKTHDGWLFRNDWKVLKKCLDFSAANSNISSAGPLEEARLFKSYKRACQWFGGFFNIYMAGSDSCLTPLSPCIWFGVVNNRVIIFSLYLICPCQQTCFKYRQQSSF